MITSVHIKNFKCFRDFAIELGPFSVLIGPNDSGKTAFLRAMQIAAHIPPGESRSLEGQFDIGPAPEAVWRNDPERHIAIGISAAATDGGEQWPWLAVSSEDGAIFHSAIHGEGSPGHERDKRRLPEDWRSSWFAEAIGDAVYYKFDPALLKRPSPLAVKMTDAGEGFTAYLDYILRTDRALFDRIEQEFLTRFPYYRKIALPTEELPGGEGVLALKFQTIREEVLSASSVSDGVMLFLAFLAISYAPRSWNVVLIEEPENGVHHTRLKEIVGTLKHLSDDKGVQVILTTHSPYLLDFVQPEEVHVFTRGQVGEVHTKRLSEYEDADEIHKHFQTGEMWSILSEEHGI